jgi:hypothetical protein
VPISSVPGVTVVTSVPADELVLELSLPPPHPAAADAVTAKTSALTVAKKRGFI